MLGKILLFFYVTICTIAILYVPFFIGIVSDVQDNWNEYRCSPTVLPVSGYINKEEHLSASEATQQNFEYCTGVISGSFMEEILQPVNYISSNLTNLTSDMNNNFQAFRKAFENIRDSIMAIINQIFGTFANLTVATTQIVINLSKIIGKLQGVIVASAYTLQTTSYALGSAWNGQPGDFIRKVAKVI
jgi:hypothetical protein